MHTANTDVRPASDDEVRWSRRCWMLLAAVLAFRLGYAAVVPLDLISDESYYWDWSRRPDWGYYSKPPMIAWLIAASTGLFGSTAFTVRLPAVLLSTLGLVFVFLLGRRTYDARVGFWAVVTMLACPGGVVAGLMMTIDAPLLCCWGLTTYAVWRMLEPGSRRAGWCGLAIVATGLGLLSKQTMFALPVLVGLFVLTSREDRVELARPALWLWGLVSPLFLVPVLWWNAHHGWITFQHTRHHFDGETVPLAKRLGRFAEYVGGQFGVLSPVTCFLAAAVFVGCLVAFRRLERRERFLFLIGGFPLYGVLALSLVQRVQPNWPAPFYVGGLLLTVAWALGRFDLVPWIDGWRSHFRGGLVVGGVCAAATLLVPFAVQPAGLAGSDLDPTDRLRGWRELGERVQALRETVPRPERTFLVAAGDRATVSALAFYLPDQPRVHRWNSGNHIESQYELWDRPAAVGWDALLVLPAGAALPPELAGAYESVAPLGEVTVPLGNDATRSFKVLHARGFRGWPKPAPLAALEAARRG
jgi:4-amino-4-deoxy-L-arabinose transferase-like glycosyltransferase